MTFDLQKLLESKRAFRRNLAARPVAEKLRLLDELLERFLTLRSAKPTTSEAGALHEEPPPYGKPDKPA